MVDVKWIKIVTDIFDDEKILLIESMPESDSIIVIWFKLLCLAGKNNNSGVFMMNDKIAYTDEMLATIFRRPLNTVRLALNTFEKYGMIEIVNNVLTIPNWSKHQTLDQIEERKKYMKSYMKNYREKQKLIATGEENSKVNSKVNGKVNVNALDKEVEEEVEIDKEEDIYINSISKDILVPKNLVPIADAWNSLNLSKVKSIKDNRLKMLNARIKEYGIETVIEAIKSIEKSSFLKGQNNRNWIITFNWLIKPNNFTKVMEGNYLDKEGESDAGNNQGTRKELKDEGIGLSIDDL